MNSCIKNLNRIEFVITYACTGQCKHCSQGEHGNNSEYIDGTAAAQVIYDVARKFKIESVMTFGGEALLHPTEVCRIHEAAREMGIPKRQLITNGFFSRDTRKIQYVATELAKCGVNDVLLSVDAFHQETIPLEPVKFFAEAIKSAGIKVRTSPAWLVSETDDNPYNEKTRDILDEFELIGISPAEGNIIFPEGNALKYLREYFDPYKKYVNPYEESPDDIRTISVEPNGDVLSGNIYEKNILDILTK